MNGKVPFRVLSFHSRLCYRMLFGTGPVLKLPPTPTSDRITGRLGRAKLSSES